MDERDRLAACHAGMLRQTATVLAVALRQVRERKICKAQEERKHITMKHNTKQRTFTQQERREKENQNRGGNKESSGSFHGEVKVPPMTADTIEKRNQFPVSDAPLTVFAVYENVKKKVANADSLFTSYIKGCEEEWIAFSNYDVLLPTDLSIPWLIENYRNDDYIERYTFLTYGNGGDQKRGNPAPLKLPEGFKFDVPGHKRGNTSALCPLLFDRYKKKLFVWNFEDGMGYTINKNNGEFFNGSRKQWAAEIKVAPYTLQGESLLTWMVFHNFHPEISNDAVQSTVDFCFDLKKAGLLTFSENQMNLTKIYEAVFDFCQTHHVDGVMPKDREEAFSIVEGSMDPLLQENVVAALLSMDTVRADIKEYDTKMLEDPGRGSWELWDAPYHDMKMVTLPRSGYARDPRKDIFDGGVVGIDFGTKSTVVVVMENSDRIRPMRIGTGRLEKAVSARDYENPTVLEFNDVASFLQAYGTGEGRPLTRWSDITSSHTASENWNANDDSDEYFAYLGEMKQWAGDSERRIRIRDKKGKEIDLPPYDKLKDGDFDPIEIYAYYIGLYINNMHTHHIYMEYLLSFPVTYSLDIRNRIRGSFSRGLRRSLPQTVLHDSSCMENFSVKQGAGEPAAYAVCALQSYGFRPHENEPVFYGIFDFGGGTTDFDFGIWRKARKDIRERKYHYVITHFGDGGDRFLGGENLLELLAFAVFKDNQNVLRKNSIPFAKPGECESFAGSELLIDNSQEAHTNLRQLAELLRPFWERTPEYEKKYTAGVLKTSLFNRNGERIEGFELKVDTKKLEDILRKRISRGIDQFFEALLHVYHDDAYRDLRKQTDKIHIFLAGNSCKSVLLQELFREKTAYFTKALNDIIQKNNGTAKAAIEIYPPLGTEEAKKKMEALHVVGEAADSLEAPTGKTGVAIGLVECRTGSVIKVINEKKTDEEIKFRYWVGFSDDGYLEPVLSRDSQYGAWVPYQLADVDRFEFYFTSSPSASRSRGILTKETTKVRERLPERAVDEDWMIYLRAAGPDTVEFAVAEDDKALQNGHFCYGPVVIELKEGE